MKTSIVSVLAIVSLLLIVTGKVCAQSDGTSFKIPFAFVVADKELPAGEYFVRSLYWNAVAIQPSESKDGVITLAQRSAMPGDAEPKLIFHKYGNRFFLSEARLPHMDTARRFRVSREELEIAGKVTKESVEVAAR